MLDKDQYLEILKKYGHCASWAVWAEAGLKPKSNVGDLSIFYLESNQRIVDLLRPDVIMVGLNISRPIEYTFGNFHDKRPQSQDYKIRYAFKDTPFYGAYMTDIIKDFEQVVSGNVIKYLKSNPDFEKKNIEAFEQELSDIGAKNPLIIAFGNDSYSILNRHLGSTFRVVKVPHYSMQISKEKYADEVKRLLSEVQPAK